MRVPSLNMINFIHPWSEGVELARRLETVTGLSINLVPAPPHVSGPTREDEVRKLFRVGEMDIGCV